MNKLVLKQTGEPVKKGETLVKVAEVLGIPVSVEEIVINDKTLPDLIKAGVIVSEGSDIDINYQKSVAHLANRIGWNQDNLEKYLNNLYKISPAAVFGVVLREVAIMLDKKYPDHINNSKEVWIINALNGEIQRVKNLNRIKNYRNFAAFRSLKDAMIAKKVMAPALKDLYGKQKN